MKEVCVFSEGRTTRSFEQITVQGFPKLYGVVIKLLYYYFYYGIYLLYYVCHYTLGIPMT